MGQTTLGLLRPFVHGRGYRRSVAGTQPAAGATFTHKVSGDAWERLVAVTFTLTTSSFVANRIVTVDYAQSDIGTILQDGAAVAQTASATGVFNGSAERTNSEWNTGTATFFPLWGGFLESGSTFTISVAGIDTADQLSGIIFTTEVFEVGRGGYQVGGQSTDDLGMTDDAVPR